MPGNETNLPLWVIQMSQIIFRRFGLAALLPQAFQMFAQLNPSIDRAEGGLGIGLSVVKTLVELHQGSVEAHSEGPGSGTEFVVRLPSAQPPETSVSPSPDGHALPIPVEPARVMPSFWTVSPLELSPGVKPR